MEKISLNVGSLQLKKKSIARFSNEMTGNKRYIDTVPPDPYCNPSPITEPVTSCGLGCGISKAFCLDFGDNDDATI